MAKITRKNTSKKADKMPAFLNRKTNPAPADPAPIAVVSVTEIPAAPAAPAPELYAINSYTTKIAGENATVYEIAVWDSVKVGPFDTENAAVTFRDTHFISKAKGRKSAVKRTPADAGKMTEKYANRMVSLVQMPENGAKLASQAEGCIECLAALLTDNGAENPVGATVSQGGLVEAILADAGGARAYVNTTQSPKRIWDFYRKALTDAGYIMVD